MLKFLTKFIDTNQQTIKRYQTIVDKINAKEGDVSSLDDASLRSKTSEFKLRLERGEILEDVLVEAFAVVREASKRVNNQRHFDVQLMAGLAFHEGKVAEQKTGEGKTLSATTAVYLNALAGHGAHVVTVNDYLAQRDGGWMGAVYDFLGLKTSVIIHETSYIFDKDFENNQNQDWRQRHLKRIERRDAYLADITYGTNNEFGFDYLRDNMVMQLTDKSQRKHFFAIVDEVDSILIDEARTPLIISAPDSDPTDKYVTFAKLIETLNPKIDYVIDEKLRTAHLTETGITKLEKKLNVSNLYEKDFETIHHVENAVRARSLFERDRHYVVKDNEIIIVDEFTGRLMYGRRYSEGLHQAIEAKENVTVQQESRTLATVSIQNYFRMYEKLAGMTGTASTEAEEFHKIYKMDVITIPTNRSMVRKDLPDYIYKNERAKIEAIGREIEEVSKTGQPILVGTRDIEHNELLGRLLKHKGVKHSILNAKNHTREAMILAKAGEKGSVTIATNMAGRGVDIALGGDEPKMSLDKDPQEFEKELEQWKKSSEEVKQLGGLYVLGSERHESRRIDNQLRGRAGRQGDPGTTRFFVALDDEIMRIFGGDQIQKVMGFLKMPENVPIEHAMVGRAIENAQTKVEGHYFDMRKHVVEYDDVMNKQREIIYGVRDKILDTSIPQTKQEENIEVLPAGDETQTSVDLQAIDAIVDEKSSVQNNRTLRVDILGKLEKEIHLIVGSQSENEYSNDDFVRMTDEIGKIIPFDDESRNQLGLQLQEKKHADAILEYVNDLIENVYTSREFQFGEQAIAQMERAVYLSTLDELWMDHLDQMTALRDGIQLRAYGQRDPLVEYKGEAFKYFQRLLSSIDFQLVRKIFHVLPNNADQLLMQNAFKQIYEIGPNQNADSSSVLTELSPEENKTKPDKDWKLVFNQAMKESGTTSIKNEEKIGRNDLCPCGSGKKWKACGLKNSDEHQENLRKK
ncbi:MAG: preprotein translocase subunit SecA [bacterium]|nr:preprotein translocase subunit SecA [bacterium]